MGTGTTDPSYWLNWRFLLCAVWVLSSMAAASILIWKYEDSDLDGKEGEEAHQGNLGNVYEDESWMPCLKTIHPAWLLVFRVVALFVCAVLVVVNILVKGASEMYYYTQWTCLLVTIYFGIGSLLSAYGCHQYSKFTGERIDYLLLDPEGSTYFAPVNYGKANDSLTVKNPELPEHLKIKKILGLGRFLFQIIYQTNAGAVVITDFVFWLIIFPFLTSKDYDLSYLQIGMHSLNAIFLIGDTALNRLVELGQNLTWYKSRSPVPPGSVRSAHEHPYPDSVRSLCAMCEGGC